MPLRTSSTPPIAAALTGDRPTAGEYVPDREAWNAGTLPLTSGSLALTFWTADKSEAINNVKLTTGSVAAAATPTLCRMGIYSVNAAGDLTALLASTASDTTLFAATATAYTKALTSQFDKVAGQRYATAVIVVSGAATPTFVGAAAQTTAGWYQHMFDLPAKCSRVTGQTDLGASYTRAQQAVWPYRVGFTLT